MASPRRSRAGWLPWLAAATAAAATVVVIGGWAGPAASLPAAGIAWLVVRRLEPARQRRSLQRAAADLPIAADLLAGALRSGAPVGPAAKAVGAALDGPVGERLRMVGEALLAGGLPSDAWAYLTDVPGGERLARAAVRSADSGAALVATLDRLADDLRTARIAAAEAAARRLGVLIVLPLGLCFLPAFLLAGVVPVVVAVLGEVLR
jgi:pilus assembly protein TadC